MEGELWNGLYHLVVEVGKEFHSRCVQFSNSTIVLVFFWAVLHDRPVSWACREDNWPQEERFWPHPSPATMSRRLRTPLVQSLLKEVQRRSQEPLPPTGWSHLDGKSLPIGGSSRDPDAGYGRAAGGTKAKGYKLHALWDAGGAVLAWELQPIQVAEAKVACRLVRQSPAPGLVLADANYDDNELYDQAGACGQQLIAAKRYPQARGLGHQYQSLYRLRALRMLDDGVGWPLLLARRAIERQFGSLGNFSGGLGPLPHWVRRLPRVRRWVQAKLILNALRLVHNKGLAA